MTVRFLPHGVKQILDEKGDVQRTLSPGDGLVTSKEDRAKLVLSSPDRVQLVKDLFDWYLSEGMGFKSIADRLNRGGIPSPGRTNGPDIRQKVIEGFLFEEIGRGIKAFLGGDEGSKMLRKALLELIGPDDRAGDNKRQHLLAKRNEIESRIYSIIDNLTPTTREFADKRVTQLKGEMEAVQAEIDHHEESTARRMDIDKVVPQLLGYMASMSEVVAEGTVDEKRRFLRAFVRKVELDPKTGTGRVEIYDLPLFGTSVQKKKDDQGDRPSSFLMVAGAGFDTDSSSLDWEEIELESLAAVVG